MGQYVYDLACAAVFAAVVLSLSPDGETGKIGKYIAFVAALVMTVAMLSPIPGLLSEGGLSIEAEELSQPSAEEGEKKGEYLANNAGMALSSLYGTSLSKICAYVTCNDAGEVSKIILEIEGEADFDTKEAGEILTEIYKTDIEVKDIGTG